MGCLFSCHKKNRETRRDYTNRGESSLATSNLYGNTSRVSESNQTRSTFNQLPKVNPISAVSDTVRLPAFNERQSSVSNCAKPQPISTTGTTNSFQNKTEVSKYQSHQTVNQISQVKSISGLSDVTRKSVRVFAPTSSVSNCAKPQPTSTTGTTNPFQNKNEVSKYQSHQTVNQISQVKSSGLPDNITRKTVTVLVPSGCGSSYAKPQPTSLTVTTNSFHNENQVSKYYQTIKNLEVFENNTESSFNQDSKLTTSTLINETPWIIDDGQSTDDSTDTEESDANLSIHGLPCTKWTDVEYISEFADLRSYVAKNLVKLFKEDNTVPFIARYRRNMTCGMEAEELRSVKEIYDRAKAIRHKAATVIRTIDKQGKWTPDIHAVVSSAKSLIDLDHISSMFKAPSTRSLADKARELGLGHLAESILQAQKIADLSTYINYMKEGLKSVKEIKDGIIHILSDAISKDRTLFEKIRELRKTTIIQIQVSKGKSAKKEDLNAKNGVKVENEVKSEKKNFDPKKYENYYEFKANESNIKPHQILAINRGEYAKFLSVKIIIPDSFKRDLKNHVLNLYAYSIRFSLTHASLINAAFDYSYRKNIKPAIVRRFRGEMKERAEIASIKVFAENLKQLILTPPFKGTPVLGIDPGFYHGCKVAVISENGDVLRTIKIYPHPPFSRVGEARNVLVSLVRSYDCISIALGNGTACRETERFLADIIKAQSFAPWQVSFTIINEAGASTYSCSEEARNEFPKLDPCLISAVSIARRLQDPLAELVKVEPKHLGVGMYQHDLPEKQLDLTLNSVITEAVSFVGVDVNTASHCLLRKIAGLNPTKAASIIEWRKKNAAFTNREQLLDVKGIEKKSYEQCVGFIRIVPETALVSGSKSQLRYLDQTWIHPESYNVASEIVKACNANLQDLGTKVFINSVNAYASQGFPILAAKLKTSEETIGIIVKGLTMTKGYDIRSKMNKHVFRSSLTKFDSLTRGTTLKGIVRNITHFGAFVDVGVSRDGLIPTMFMKGVSLSIGQLIEVKVVTVEKERGRLCIEFIKTL